MPASSLASEVEIVGHELSAEAADRRSGIGAHLRARADLGPNVVILTETPFAAVPVDELAAASTICHQCFVDVDPDGPEDNAAKCCSVCAAAWYCSDECRSRAATFVHADSSSDAGDAECSTLRRLRGSFEGTRDARLLCRIQRTRCGAISDRSRTALISGSLDQMFADLVYHDAETPGTGTSTAHRRALTDERSNGPKTDPRLSVAAGGGRRSRGIRSGGA